MILQYQNRAALQYDDHVFFWKGIHRQERKLFDRREQVFYTILKSDMKMSRALDFNESHKQGK